MLRTKCDNCQGTDLVHDHLAAADGVVIAHEYRPGEFEFAPVRCMICLGCGAVYPYVEPAGVAQIRAWRDGHYTEQPAQPAPTAAQSDIKVDAPVPAPGGTPTASDDSGDEDEDAPPKQGGAGFGTVVIVFAIIGTIFGILNIISDWMAR